MKNVWCARSAVGLMLVLDACAASTAPLPDELQRADAAVRSADAVEHAEPARRICASLLVRTDAELAAASECDEVDGDLKVDLSESPDVRELDLPRLREVSGSLVVVLPAALERVALPALTAVGTAGRGSAVEIGFDSGGLRRVELPALREVHGSFGVAALPGLEVLDTAALVRVDGLLLMESLPSLTELSFGSGLVVGGQLIASGLCSLPASALLEQRIGVDEPAELRGLGCCTESAFGCPYSGCACDALGQ